MRPPVCAICDEDLMEDEGGIVYFKKRFSDKVWDRKMERIKGVGHPPYAEWFCDKHIKLAQEVKHLTIDKALLEIRKLD